MKKVYIATPYTNVNHEDAFSLVNEVASEYMKNGYVVFSPITHGHIIADYLPDKCRSDSDFWLHQCLPFLKMCDRMVLVSVEREAESKLKNSSGCQRELDFCLKYNIPVEKLTGCRDVRSNSGAVRLHGKHRNAINRLFEIGVLNEDDTRSYNVGESNYSDKLIQPWSVWMEWELNAWDADIIKRVLRDKKTDSRTLDYEKIIHICRERIRQLKND